MPAARVLQELQVSRWMKSTAGVVVALLAQAAIAATADTAKPAEPAKAVDKAKAAENRKKPLQRCDELADKAQTDCLQKARQHIVEARKKREAAGDKRSEPREKPAASKDSGAKDAAPSK